jgi:hypothetical protein
VQSINLAIAASVLALSIVSRDRESSAVSWSCRSSVVQSSAGCVVVRVVRVVRVVMLTLDGAEGWSYLSEGNCHVVFTASHSSNTVSNRGHTTTHADHAHNYTGVVQVGGVGTVRGHLRGDPSTLSLSCAHIPLCVVLCCGVVVCWLG